MRNVFYAHQNVFVMKENPQLGFTNLVQHEIYLKPNFVLEYQRPYRLPPDKREVLRTQLDELLSQGVFSLLVKQIVCLLLALFFWSLRANPMDLMLPRVRMLTLLYTGFVVI